MTEKYEDLTILKGIGDKTAEKLVERGITEIAQVAIMRPDELAEILGWTKMKAKETITAAKEIAMDTTMVLMNLGKFKKDIEDLKIHYSTGSIQLDKLIGGGVTSMEILGLRAEYASGKTQICYSTAVSAIEKKRKVAWVEVESGTFATSRLYEIAKNRGVEVEDDDVFLTPARLIRTPASQFMAYERIAKEIKKGLDVGLIIVDSFSPRLREAYPAREMFPARNQEIVRHLGFLQGLASEYNIAIILTSQIMGVPDTNKAKETLKKEASDQATVLGESMKHMVQTWLSLNQVSRANKLYEATLIDSSYLPPGKAQFLIDEMGVRDA